MAEKIRLLLVEDSDDDAALIVRTLRKGGYEVDFDRVDTAEQLKAALDRQEWDLVLSDYAMPGFSGLMALDLLRERELDLPFILVSGAVGEETATKIMRQGARDYVMKDKLARLVPAVQRELAETRNRRQRRKAEEMLQSQLHQSQKMEAIGTLAGGVAHDFNNLLTVIKGYAELTLRLIKPEDPGHAEVREIHTAAQRAADLTRQLLAFARKQTVTPQKLDLNETVTAMLKMLHRLIGEDIELVWQPTPDLWPVKIDPGQVDQILANLCVNARDAIADTGRISIETNNVSLDEAYCAGMDRETQRHLFEPFFTTKEVGKGTGLGLATVYGIIKQNQGFINFYSEPGQGTIFRIYLPRHELDDAPATAHQSEPLSATGGPETILLVEDDATILDVTRKMLEGLGYRVLAVPAPSMALQLAMEHPGSIDLLLSDVVMPEINGQELARQLRALRPDTRCLFMSGYTADIIAHNGLLEAGIHFLQKPFSLTDLANKIRAALNRE